MSILKYTPIMADLSCVQGLLYVVDFNCAPLEIISTYVYFKITFYHQMYCYITCTFEGGHRSPAVACWASDHWVASVEPTQGKVSSLISPHYPRRLLGPV